MKSIKNVSLTKKGLLAIMCISFALSVHAKPEDEIPKNTEKFSAEVMVFSMIENHSGFDYEFGGKTISGKREVTVSGFTENKLEPLQIWLLQQQHEQRDIVLKNAEGEYLLTERDVKPRVEVEKIMQMMQAHLQYPDFAANIGESGTVHVLFLINEHGLVEKVVTDISRKYNSTQMCDKFEEAAMKCVKATDGLWTPATINGKAVKKWMYVPVRFELKS